MQSPALRAVISAIASAIQTLNRDGGNRCVCLGLFTGKPARYLELLAMEPGETGEDFEAHKASRFQTANGGRAGLQFYVADRDGEDLDEGGGQFDGYLSNNAAELPRRTAMRAARDIVETLANG